MYIFHTNTLGITSGVLSGGTMTRSSGERTTIENKQATAQLPHRENNIDYHLSNLPKHFITTTFLLGVCVHRPRMQSRNPVQV